MFLCSHQNLIYLILIKAKKLSSLQFLPLLCKGKKKSQENKVTGWKERPLQYTCAGSVGFYLICSPFLKRNNYVSKPPFPVQSAASFHINAICMRHLLLPFNNLNLHFLFTQLSDSFTYHISIFNTEFAPLFLFFKQEIDFPSNLTTSQGTAGCEENITYICVS